MSKLPATFLKDFHDEELCRCMEYRCLGKTGLEVSKLGLGTATLSDLFGDLDLDEAIKTIHEALKSGINYIDTAPYYGQGRSEEVLGLALKNIPRQTYYIATKVGRYEKTYDRMFDYSAKKTRASFERSLELLGLDYVDVIQIHDIEFAKNMDIIVNECIPELEKIVKEGKARFIGVTSYSPAHLKECVQHAPKRIDVVLSFARYTLADDSLLSYLSFFQEQNVGLVCAAGHAMGMLTNAGPFSWHPASDEIKQLCRKAADICKKANVELGKLAIYHFTQLKGVSTFLVGMQTRKLLELNLYAMRNPLTKTEQEVLKVLRETVFKKPVNWEGLELKKYWAAIDSKKH